MGPSSSIEWEPSSALQWPSVIWESRSSRGCSFADLRPGPGTRKRLKKTGFSGRVSLAAEAEKARSGSSNADLRPFALTHPGFYPNHKSNPFLKSMWLPEQTLRSVMWLDFERRVTFLLPIGCLLILIFLLPTPLKVLPPRPAILSWNQLNNSTPVATLKSTMLNSWYFNRFNSKKDALKGQDNADVLSDSP